MRSALITGISGQDGSYLAELLLKMNYRVIGAVRDPQKSFAALPLEIQNEVELVSWNMLDQNSMIEVLKYYKPIELYNLSAYSSGAGMYNDPIRIGEVNGIAVARILEAIRYVDTGIRFCQASSREVFGDAIESPQSELTPMNPRSPYGAAKLYADAMIKIYRKHYGIFACSAILFNHESPRRNPEFVTRKITREAAKIKLGQEKRLYLGNLDVQRDWGFAGDFVRAMWLMLQQDKPDDYVIATGKSHSVRELCELAFSHLGLDYRDHVFEDISSFRPAEENLLVGDISKASNRLNWQPKMKFDKMIQMMVDEDLINFSNLK